MQPMRDITLNAAALTLTTLTMRRTKANGQHELLQIRKHISRFTSDTDLSQSETKYRGGMIALAKEIVNEYGDELDEEDD